MENCILPKLGQNQLHKRHSFDPYVNAKAQDSRYIAYKY